jgi:hypothetical protein
MGQNAAARGRLITGEAGPAARLSGPKWKGRTTHERVAFRGLDTVVGSLGYDMQNMRIKVRRGLRADSGDAKLRPFQKTELAIPSAQPGAA